MKSKGRASGLMHTGDPKELIDTERRACTKVSLLFIYVKMTEMSQSMLEAQDDSMSSDFWLNQVCMPPEATGTLGQRNPNSLYLCHVD